jgi:hypothetical protein
MKSLLMAFSLTTLPLMLHAQGAAPDIAGFRPGTPAADAYKQLQQYAGPGRRIVVGHQNVPDLNAGPIIHELQMSEGDPDSSAEVIELDVTLPPEPQRVWRVVRMVRLNAGHEMLPQALIEGLHTKYGPEQRPMSDTVRGMWWFDHAGARQAVPTSMTCDGVIPTPKIDGGIQYTTGAGTQRSDLLLPLQRVDASFAPCRTLTEVGALYQTEQAHHLVISYIVQLMDLGIEAHAHEATVAQLADRAAAREAATKKRAAQEKPSL